MIEVEGLTKVYGNTTAIDSLTFTVQQGEVVGFLGPNGAGKTTTMRVLSCYMPPTSGTARVGGYDIRTQALDVRRRIGYLPEHVPLSTDLTVTQYLGFVPEAKGLSRLTRRQRVGEAIERGLLQDARGRIIGKLSKGYRQRVGLAQALLGDPPILILDEPTIGLDPKQIIEIRSLIRDMQGKRTGILSTHILPQVTRVVCTSGWVLVELRPVDMSLEDIFIRLVTTEETVVSD